jgi:hypothetical protein
MDADLQHVTTACLLINAAKIKGSCLETCVEKDASRPKDAQYITGVSFYSVTARALSFSHTRRPSLMQQISSYLHQRQQTQARDGLEQDHPMKMAQVDSLP